MTRAILFVATIAAITTVLGTCGTQVRIKRLDGTTITPSEIDATITRLMKAAEVPGLGIAVLNDGNITYLKAYGARDKESCRNLEVSIRKRRAG